MAKTKKRFFRWLEDNRGLIIVVFCLPASFLWDSTQKLLQYLYQSLMPNSTHEARVSQVQKAVRKWNTLPDTLQKPMCTARPNWLSLSTTFFDKTQCHKIPVNLYSILNLDEQNLLIKKIPIPPVHHVYHSSGRFLIIGYTLAVTLEFGDATCGGLALAVGMTTYSHKVGLYQETVESYEVVMADGSVVTARADNEYSDLFRCLPWSHGTLGFLVALELKIIPVKPYVHLRYIPIKGLKTICDRIREKSGALDPKKEVADYVECTLFSPDEAVLMLGNFHDVTNSKEMKKVNPVSKWYKPWFYKHTESFLKKGESDEYIPLQDYLLRHNRAIFWVLESMIPFGNHPIFRFFLGWLCPPKPAFLKFTTTPGVRTLTFTKQVFQDIVLPMTVLEKSILLNQYLFDTFPLLVYPCRIYDHGKQSGQLRAPRKEQMTPGANYGMFYDLGIYGTPGKVKRREKYDAVTAMREMERFTRQSGGYPFLYADTFMHRNEFEQMFDLQLYEKVRTKYGAHKAFPHLYDKTKPEIDVFKIGKEALKDS